MAKTLGGDSSLLRPGQDRAAGPASRKNDGSISPAWGLWKQRRILVPASIITSVLLLCDAWFDLLTANGHRDLIVSARALEQDAQVSSLWRTPLITLPGPSKIQ